jgi:hypothetical protein
MPEETDEQDYARIEAEQQQTRQWEDERRRLLERLQELDGLIADGPTLQVFSMSADSHWIFELPSEGVRRIESEGIQFDIVVISGWEVEVDGVLLDDDLDSRKIGGFFVTICVDQDSVDRMVQRIRART